MLALQMGAQIVLECIDLEFEQAQFVLALHSPLQLEVTHEGLRRQFAQVPGDVHHMHGHQAIEHGHDQPGQQQGLDELGDDDAACFAPEAFPKQVVVAFDGQLADFFMGPGVGMRDKLSTQHRHHARLIGGVSIDFDDFRGLPGAQDVQRYATHGGCRGDAADLLVEGFTVQFPYGMGQGVLEHLIDQGQLRIHFRQVVFPGQPGAPGDHRQAKEQAEQQRCQHQAAP
ncbi:hypothetical protein D3C76_1008860 [compost metagenome]